MARQIDAPGFYSAGYQNFTTSTFAGDGTNSSITEQVHGGEYFENLFSDDRHSQELSRHVLTSVCF